MGIMRTAGRGLAYLVLSLGLILHGELARSGAHSCNPSSWEMAVKDPEVQDRPQFLSSSVARLGHIGLCLLTAKTSVEPFP